MPLNKEQAPGYIRGFDAVTGRLKWQFNPVPQPGEPVWPIEERPVPPSDVPGEKLAPTQPFPTKPAPFDRQGITEEDLIDFTPELRAEALEIFRQYRSGPLFTPPSVRDEPPGGTLGTLQLPSYVGGNNLRPFVVRGTPQFRLAA